jgi:hypothetical protein
VAAVWIEGSKLLGQFQNSVVLHGKDRSRHDIRSYHGCYDALSYPLFFPKGELGWHMDIPKKGVSMEEVIEYRALQKARSGSENETGLLFFLFKYFAYMYLSDYSTNNSNLWLFFVDSPGRLCVSVRDYYCYKFQMRPGIFNPILYGKRLFQQFAVDTYIKIESSRLDYIRNHQDDI